MLLIYFAYSVFIHRYLLFIIYAIKLHDNFHDNKRKQTFIFFPTLYFLNSLSDN